MARIAGKLPFVSRDKLHQLYHGDWVARGDGWPLKEPVDFVKGFSLTLDWYRRLFDLDYFWPAFANSLLSPRTASTASAVVIAVVPV